MMKLEGKKVLITGAGGFIGSHLSERLLQKGCQVRALVHYNSMNHWGNLEDVPAETRKRLEVVTGDIRDPFNAHEVVKGCDVVFHLAALIGIPYSYVAPQSYVETNILGTVNILQACRSLGVQKIVHTSTSETYGTALYTPIDEKHPMQGQSPYSASKIGADKMAESYFKSFGMPVATIRPFNTYGPRQSARAVIPTIISQALTGKSEIRLGSLSPFRDLTYVLDTADGFIAVAESEQSSGEVINVGNGTGVTIGDLAQTILRLMGKEKSIRIVADEARVRPEKSEVMELLADASQAEKLCGWKPKHTLEQGLRETIAWIEKNRDRYKPEIYNV